MKYTSKQLSTMNHEQLKHIAIEMNLGSGAWRQGARKQVLIDSILAGAPTEGFGTTEKVTPSSVTVTEEVKDLIKAAVEDALKKALAGEAEPTPAPEALDLTKQHYRFPLLVRYTTLTKMKHVMLVGPAGSGKTSAVEALAKHLNVAFAAQSFCNQTSLQNLLGYMDANGKYVASAFRKVFENGGIFCGDELDNGNPNITAALNSALANGFVQFPDRLVYAHETFVFVGGANTYGMGANAIYVGRNPLDGAFRNRLRIVAWGYDEALESQWCAQYNQPEWVRYVQKCRHAADKLGIRHVISPRASLMGAEALAAGSDWETEEECSLWTGLDQASIDKIKANLAA